MIEYRNQDAAVADVRSVRGAACTGGGEGAQRGGADVACAHAGARHAGCWGSQR